MTLCVMKIILKFKYQPIAVCEVELNSFTYICTQSLSKRIINKELHIIPLKEYAECISYLGECVQPKHPLVVIYCL
jgi:hypothetical protein